MHKDGTIATEDTVITGAPVGTDECINTTVADRVDGSSTSTRAALHHAGPVGACWGVHQPIICPGSQRLVSKGADTIPGKAAAKYDGKKKKTYRRAGESG